MGMRQELDLMSGFMVCLVEMGLREKGWYQSAIADDITRQHLWWIKYSEDLRL